VVNGLLQDGERLLRLNAWLARAGVASRRGADELIKAAA
jgi:16S rRNA U516 pseudouridylate synthase RsuA-like enzyme